VLAFNIEAKFQEEEWNLKVTKVNTLHPAARPSKDEGMPCTKGEERAFPNRNQLML